MIISHKYRFIFVKTYKTAGTSIETYLSQQCGEDDILTPIKPHVAPHRARNSSGLFNPIPEMISARGRGATDTFRDLRWRRRFYNHLPAYKIRARVRRNVWRRYFKFCVERNPWDRTLSLYHMMQSRNAYEGSFASYLQSERLYPNYPLYTEHRSPDRIIVDRVLRYEDLANELREVFSFLGVPFSGKLEINAKSTYRTDRRPYDQVYTKAEQRIVAQTCAQEVRLHGYHF